MGCNTSSNRPGRVGDVTSMKAPLMNAPALRYPVAERGKASPAALNPTSDPIARREPIDEGDWAERYSQSAPTSVRSYKIRPCACGQPIYDGRLQCYGCRSVRESVDND